MNKNKNKNAERQRAAKMMAGAKRMRAIWMALAMGFSVNLSVNMAVAQQDPTTIGAGQKPMVIILMDTSASMEFTTAGEGRYPRRTGATGQDMVEWEDGSLLNEGMHMRNNLMPGNIAPTSRGPELAGPCYVWEPVCSDYERPSWYPNTNLMPQNVSGPMKNRLDAMRGLLSVNEVAGVVTLGAASDLVRFKDESQPRHVQLKEILTGDMILSPRVNLGMGQSLPSEQLFSLLNPQDHGPGCWFVPRMGGSGFHKDILNMCNTNADGIGTTFTTSPENQSFNEFVDYTDPRPHFQEVHDRQLPTGLMDNLAGTVIFAVAMFDGIQGEYEKPAMGAGRVKSGTHRTNDGMSHVDGSVLSGPFTSTPTRTPVALAAESDDRYNLGVYKIIGPALMDIGARPTLLPSLSRMTQLALVDAGYLRNGNGKTNWEVKASDDANEINYTLPRELEDYIVPFQMGHQPIAYATPLAAAMRDIHKFFVGGQKAFRKDGSVSPAANTVYDPYNIGSNVKVKDVDKDTMIHSPITTDPYQYCRAKHVVMMTDGFPQPEWGNGLGSDRLNDVYKYNDKDALYPYGTAETEIAALVNDQRINPPMINGQMVDPKFQSRVHIVGLNVGDAATQAVSCTAADTSLNCQVRRKLGLMARAGNTCAYYYLCDPGASGLCEGDGKKYIPNSGAWPVKGTCDPATENCLVLQLESNEFTFNPPNGGAAFVCPAPALLLQKNDRPATAPMGQVATVRDDLTQALQFVLNEVIDASGGVASRTRTSVTNTLDQFAGGLPKTGQYRFYSGVDVGGGVFWKGILNRQELVCEGAAGANTTPSDDLTMDVTKAPREIHEDIAAQVTEAMPGNFKDNRRIFSIKPLLDGTGKLVAPANTESGLYPISFELVRLTAGQDEFMEPPTDPTMTQPGRLRGARLPFRIDALVRAQNASAITALNNILNTIDLGGIPLLDATFDSTVKPALQAVFGTTDVNEVVKIVNTGRGATSEKRGRTLNAILNSSPVTVGPPELDIPVDSYRAFRARYANRPTMLYVSTLDGQLHAIHAGEMNGAEERVLVRQFVKVREDSQFGETGIPDHVIPGTTNKNFEPVPMNQWSQREAWAYIPNMLVRKLGQSNNRQPNLMDGTPVVADVRLCDGRANLNQSVQACRSFRDSGTISPEDQWRTVLVQGLGASGAGYFAIDITRAGGPTSASGDVISPDPIPLWEFNVGWEAEQIERLKAAGKQSRYSPEGTVALPVNPDTNMLVTDTGCAKNFGQRGFDDYSFLGLSASEPAIGTVALHSTSINASVQRPVAVFSGGIKGDIPEHDACVLNARMGRAFYVVDMQTGSLLRRFVSYRDKAGAEVRFDAEVSGAPALFDTTPGTVTSRGYVGDSKGRLFRINFNFDKNGDTRMTPEDWTMDLMFDPNDLVQGASLRTQVSAAVPGLINGADAINFGPASFRPAVALDNNRQIIVIYGLGERGETSSGGQAQAVVALRESFDAMGKLRVNADSVLWTHSFGEAEKLTGEPIVFNSGVYFTSFKENPANRCEPGKSRIWGVDFLGTANKGIRGVMPLVLPDGTDLRTDVSSGGEDGVLFEAEPLGADEARWIGPAAATLIRGVTITLGPVCSVSLDPTNQQSFDGSQDPQPQLIAQTGGATPGNAAFGGRQDPVAGGINRIVIPLRRPRTQTVPLSWANLGI
jgi:hypothetical protein